METLKNFHSITWKIDKKQKNAKIPIEYHGKLTQNKKKIPKFSLDNRKLTKKERIPIE